jgi:hypothetical protein
MAQIRLLLTDGCGPLYSNQAPRGLSDIAAHALEDLEPAFQWSSAN